MIGGPKISRTQGSRILVLRPETRRIPETRACRILVFISHLLCTVYHIPQTIYTIHYMLCTVYDIIYIPFTWPRAARDVQSALTASKLCSVSPSASLPCRETSMQTGRLPDSTFRIQCQNTHLNVTVERSRWLGGSSYTITRPVRDTVACYSSFHVVNFMSPSSHSSLASAISGAWQPRYKRVPLTEPRGELLYREKKTAAWQEQSRPVKISHQVRLCDVRSAEADSPKEFEEVLQRPRSGFRNVMSSLLREVLRICKVRDQRTSSANGARWRACRSSST